MAHATEPAVGTWTATDLVKRFGSIPLSRVRHDPPPGLAAESDVTEIHDREGRLYELVDGVLVEKTVGTYESYLAGVLTHLLWEFVSKNDLGIVLPADGMVRLAHGLVRISDVSFISWNRLPGRKIPRDPIADLVPDLAVEVISKHNTPEEMNRKLSDYFAAAVRRVWYVYHTPRREVRVYVSPEQYEAVVEQETLGGDDVLPGFTLELKSFFAEPHTE